MKTITQYIIQNFLENPCNFLKRRQSETIKNVQIISNKYIIKKISNKNLYLNNNEAGNIYFRSMKTEDLIPLSFLNLIKTCSHHRGTS